MKGAKYWQRNARNLEMMLEFKAVFASKHHRLNLKLLVLCKIKRIYSTKEMVKLN